jgi:hypothetical protein
MTNRLVQFLFAIEITIAALSLTGCETTGAAGIQEAKLAATQAIQSKRRVIITSAADTTKYRSTNFGDTCDSPANPGARRNWLCSMRSKSSHRIANS